MAKMTKYSLWCETCAATRYTDYRTEDQGLPTVCPYNVTHTDIRDIAVIGRQDTDPMPVREIDVADLDPTYARSKCAGINFDATASQWTKHEVSWPYNVNVLNGEGYTGTSEDGDIAEFRVAPQLVGAVVAPALQDATEIVVDPGINALFANYTIFPGMVLKFKRDGVPGYPDNPDPGDDEYEIASFDPDTNTITLRTALASDVPAMSLVYLTIKYGEEMELQADEAVNVGGVAAGSAPIPANMVFEIWYFAMSNKRIRLRLNLKYGPMAQE